MASVAVLIAVASTPTPTEAHSGTYTVSAQHGLRLRDRPSKSARVKLTMPHGARVTAYKHRGNWMYLSYDGVYGWASLDYLVKGSAARARSSCYANSWGDVVCAEDWVADDVADASAYYGVNYDTLMALAACESNFVVDEVSWAGAIGLFQFLPDTFYDFSDGDVWSVRDQSYAAANALSRGYGYYWDCWSRV